MTGHIKRYRVLTILLIVLLAFGLLTGCKKKVNDPKPAEQTQEQTQEETQEQAASEEEASEEQVEESEEETEESVENPEPEPEPTEAGNSSSDEVITEPDEEESLDEDGYYYSKDDVALYIHIYGHLPDNFITKKEAKNLGWSGGSLEKFAPGKVIGGDRFGNYEGNLPDGKKYTECDIDTYQKKKRGAKRIIFSDDGYIYYTEDHYETFELLYEPG